MNKVALFDHEVITAVLRFQVRRAVMHEIAAERTARAAGSRIFGNVVGGREETRMRARGADFQRLARERVTTGGLSPRVDLGEQRRVDTYVAQVSERADGNGETR